VAECADNPAEGPTDKELEMAEFITSSLNSHSQMLDELQAGIETAQDVIETWTQGDLAAAVNALEEWLKAAQAIVAKAQPTT
jgi:hypothetical protein